MQRSRVFGCNICRLVAGKHLPCGHQVCVHDLSQRAEIVFSEHDTPAFFCPVCRSRITLPPGGYEGLPGGFSSPAPPAPPVLLAASAPLFAPSGPPAAAASPLRIGSPLSPPPLASSPVRASALAVPLDPSLRLDYLNSADVLHYLLCPICTDPFVDPISLPCGEHTFCRACIAGWSASSCPTCRTPYTPSDLAPATDKLLIRMLGDLKVYCTRRGEGCQWTGPRSNLMEHVAKTCDAHACPNAADGCEWRGKSASLAEHKAACDFASIACPAADLLCPWRGLQREREAHARECPHERLRPVLSVLISRVDTLERRVAEQETEVGRLRRERMH